MHSNTLCNSVSSVTSVLKKKMILLFFNTEYTEIKAQSFTEKNFECYSDS